MKTLEEYKQERLAWEEKISGKPTYQETIDMDGAYLFVHVQYIINNRYRLWVVFVDYEQNKRKHRCRDFSSFDEAMHNIEEFKYQVWMYFAWGT